MTGLALTRSCGMAVDISWYTRHLFLDGAFHAHEADAELIFEQFANRANAAVAEVIDVVHRRRCSCAASAGSWMDATKSVAIQRAVVSGVSRPSLMLNFKRPTRLKSYLRGSKNMPWNSAVAVSSVGGSPGRSLR